MKAIRFARFGGPDALVFEDVDTPRPGPGEVQIRHHAIGVNYIDIYRRSGAYPADLPFIPGHEGAGEVIAVELVHGSGYPLLDMEARTTVRRAAPLPAVEDAVPGDPVTVEVPIEFALHR